MNSKYRIAHLIILVLVFLAAQTCFADETIPGGQTEMADDIPMGQTEGAPVEGQGVQADVFGEEGGIFHPFLVVSGAYTDNLFTTASNEQSDFVTTFAPGIWVALPANREKLLSLRTTPTASGGLQISRIKPKSTRRYQAYVMYSPELVSYADHSGHDHFNHNAQALFTYNLNNGLAFDLIDIFVDKEDIAGDGIYDTLYRYQSNLINFITTYDPSEKLTLRFDYSNFVLDYDENVNDYRNRMDNSFDFYVFYKIKPKTALFLEYVHTIIDYDKDYGYDSKENRYYGGINWEMTTKTSGRFKAGFMEKDFDLEGIPDESGFSFELQGMHNFTAKRAMQVNAYQRFNESTTSGASSYYTTGIDAGIMQRFSEKWNGTLNLLYAFNKYNDSDREDDYIRIGPALRYKPRDWMYFDAAYYWTKKDSNIGIYDYTSNVFLLRGTVSF